MPDYEKIAASVKPLKGVIPPDKAKAALEADRAKVEKTYLPLTHEKYQGLAAQRGYSQEAQRLERVHYTHDALIDVIMAHPGITQRELAKQFGYSENWISIVMGSDAFQAALAKRRDDLLDPFVIATVEERFRGLANQSINVIAEKLETSRSADLALKALDISAKALGFGSRAAGGQTNNTQFVIQLPPKSESAESWRISHSPKPAE